MHTLHLSQIKHSQHKAAQKTLAELTEK